MEDTNYRMLAPDELVQEGDELKHHSEQEWRLANGMIGHLPKNYMKGYQFRRKIVKK